MMKERTRQRTSAHKNTAHPLFLILSLYIIIYTGNIYLKLHECLLLSLGRPAFKYLHIRTLNDYLRQ